MRDDEIDQAVERLLLLYCDFIVGKSKGFDLHNEIRLLLLRLREADARIADAIALREFDGDVFIGSAAGVAIRAGYAK